MVAGAKALRCAECSITMDHLDGETPWSSAKEFHWINHVNITVNPVASPGIPWSDPGQVPGNDQVSAQGNPA